MHHSNRNKKRVRLTEPQKYFCETSLDSVALSTKEMKFLSCFVNETYLFLSVIRKRNILGDRERAIRTVASM